MTELEKAVVSALRLSDEAAEELLTEIQRNIAVAKAELIRSGVAEDTVSAEGALVIEAIITYCLMTMGDDDLYDRYLAAFQYMQDNLRKS